MIYFQYKLLQHNIEEISKIFIKTPNKEWIYHQIVAEVNYLFPKSAIAKVDNKTNYQNCDLLILPYEESICGFLRESFKYLISLSISPKYLVFYGVKNRLIEIIPFSKWRRFLIRKMMEYYFSSLLRRLRLL